MESHQSNKVSFLRLIFLIATCLIPTAYSAPLIGTHTKLTFWFDLNGNSPASHNYISQSSNCFDLPEQNEYRSVSAEFNDPLNSDLSCVILYSGANCRSSQHTMDQRIAGTVVPLPEDFVAKSYLYCPPHSEHRRCSCPTP